MVNLYILTDCLDS